MDKILLFPSQSFLKEYIFYKEEEEGEESSRSGICSKICSKDKKKSEMSFSLFPFFVCHSSNGTNSYYIQANLFILIYHLRLP